jgi:hypothetical protein
MSALDGREYRLYAPADFSQGLRAILYEIYVTLIYKLYEEHKTLIFV